MSADKTAESFGKKTSNCKAVTDVKIKTAIQLKPKLKGALIFISNANAGQSVFS